VIILNERKNNKIHKMAQKLSPKASAAKKRRDLAYAKTDRRTKMRAENQRRRRAAKKAGKSIEGKDYDHTSRRFVSVYTNRSGHGEGTKKNNTV
jgi:hypothetical protein